jgi:prevent-host-death family protein
MTEVGLRELRQNASEVVRRVEAGESFTVTVSGRPAAQLVPAGGRRWRRYDQVADVLAGAGAPGLAADRDELDHAVRDPFAR